MAENAEQRRLYQGALYEDVRAAVRLIVAQMRHDNANVGKNINERITDRFMVHPEIIRLYDPGATMRSEGVHENPICACDRSCCDSHGG